MADWCKLYEGFLDDSKLQWAIHEEATVCPVAVWIMCECAKKKCGEFQWKGDDVELFGIAHKINSSVPKVNAGMGLLVRIGFIEILDGLLKVLNWNKYQSDYMRRSDSTLSGHSQHTDSTLSGHSQHTDSTLSGQCPDKVGQSSTRGEERRGDKKDSSEEKLETLMKSKHYPAARNLCNVLCELMVAADPKAKIPGGKTSAGIAWLTSAEALLRIDGRSPEDAERVLRWAKADKFWSTNILSMTKFREQFDKLYIKAGNLVSNKVAIANVKDNLGSMSDEQLLDLRKQPPCGSTEYTEWKKQYDIRWGIK